MPRARNGKSGGYCTRSVSRLGGWVRWIGCAAVWEAGRAVCGERHLQQTQAYSPTATEDDGVGRGDIHTYAIGFFRCRKPAENLLRRIACSTFARLAESLCMIDSVHTEPGT